MADQQPIIAQQRQRKAKEFLKPKCPVCNQRHIYKNSQICSLCRQYLSTGRKHQEAARDYERFAHLM